jgi:hypothetical protein
LKDALFSGKLKTDTGTVIRKGDDLSSKIDTSKKKPAEPEKTKMIIQVRDSATGAIISQIDSSAAQGTAVAPSENTAPKDNNRIWKEYADSLTSTLKSEVLPNKKIKSGNYYVLVEYEIGPDGQIALNNVSCSPESSFLEQQVKERFTLTAPQMIPVVTNGKARKSSKKYTFIFNKL